MVTVYDVPPDKLIGRLAEKLKGMNIEKPAFLDYVKSGAHVERPPEDPNFWWLRCASILRKAYMNGVVGVSRLRKDYGKRKNRGVKPEKHVKAGGKIIRVALQSLEKAGLLEKGPNSIGRVLTPKGRSLLDNTAKEVVSNA